MALHADLTADVERLFSSEWNIVAGRTVPDSSTTSLTFKNDGSRINATVLYADMADSTDMVDSCPDWFAAEVYKAYLGCAGKIIKAEQGEVTAYDGDRIMAVFIGEGQHDRAVRSAQKINHAVISVIRPKLAEYRFDGGQNYAFKHVIGIDTSRLLVAKIGVRNASDLVWVGRAANHAAKLASEDDASPIWISDDVYNAMTDRVRLDGGVNHDLWSAAWSEKLGRLVYRSDSFWRIDIGP